MNYVGVFRSPGVPEKANRRLETAAIASAKEGLPTTFQSDTQGPSVVGAAAGRSCIPTAIVTIITELSQSLFRIGLFPYIPAVRIHGRPTHASHVIRPRVRILLKPNPTIAATAANTAVQVAWLDTAFMPMDRLRMADALLKI
jgi:hypothetical protein